jgi:hypothetical protein
MVSVCLIILVSLQFLWPCDSCPLLHTPTCQTSNRKQFFTCWLYDVIVFHAGIRKTYSEALWHNWQDVRTHWIQTSFFFNSYLPSLPLFQACELNTYLHATAYLIRHAKKVFVFLSILFYRWKISYSFACSALMTARGVALLLLLLLSSLSPLCRVSTLFLRQTMSLGNIVLQLF